MAMLFFALMLFGYMLIMWIDLTIACLTAWSIGRQSKAPWLIALARTSEPVAAYAVTLAEKWIGCLFSRPLSLRVYLMICLVTLLLVRNGLVLLVMKVVGSGKPA